MLAHQFTNLAHSGRRNQQSSTLFFTVAASSSINQPAAHLAFLSRAAMITDGITTALKRFITLGYRLYVIPYYWCSTTNRITRSHSTVRHIFWVVCCAEVLAEVLASFTFMSADASTGITMRERVIAFMFGGAFLYSLLVQLILNHSLRRVSTCLRHYLYFDPSEGERSVV